MLKIIASFFLGCNDSVSNTLTNKNYIFSFSTLSDEQNDNTALDKKTILAVTFYALSNNLLDLLGNLVSQNKSIVFGDVHSEV